MNVLGFFLPRSFATVMTKPNQTLAISITNIKIMILLTLDPLKLAVL